MKVLAHIIHRVLSAPENTEVLERSKNEVQELCEKFPIYRNTAIWTQ